MVPHYFFFALRGDHAVESCRIGNRLLVMITPPIHTEPLSRTDIRSLPFKGRAGEGMGFGCG
jgi:hypothetical protein